MKKYIKPTISNYTIEVEDILSASGFSDQAYNVPADGTLDLDQHWKVK